MIILSEVNFVFFAVPLVTIDVVSSLDLNLSKYNNRLFTMIQPANSKSLLIQFIMFRQLQDRGNQ